MFVVKKPTKYSEYTRVQTIENIRENGKAKQKIIRNIGTARNDVELEQFIKVAHASIEYEITKQFPRERSIENIAAPLGPIFFALSK